MPGCEATGEVPSSSSEPEQEVPATDPEVEASSTNFDAAEVQTHDDIPSGDALTGKSLSIYLPLWSDMGSQSVERGESSSRPSLQFAKKVLKSVLSSWVETLSSGHLEAGFGMIKHVRDILADSAEVGLDITGAEAFVDRVITLGDKWSKTKNFPSDAFFNEMFLKPMTEIEFEIKEISQTRKQLVREKNRAEMAIGNLSGELDHLAKEIKETMRRLELLEEQSAAKWAAVVEARAKEGTLIDQIEKADEKLQRKSQEHERWLLLWEELPYAEDGSRFSAAFYGNILKKRGLEAVEAEANSLLEELSLWLKTMMD